VTSKKRLLRNWTLYIEDTSRGGIPIAGLCGPKKARSVFIPEGLYERSDPTELAEVLAVYRLE